MAKPRTAAQLVERLDHEFSWRRTEFNFMKGLVARSAGRDEVSAVRASVPLLYAHWEGFIKRSACYYTEFLSSQRLTYSQVKLGFAGLKAQAHVATMADVKKRVFTSSVLLSKIHEIDKERLNISLNSHLDNLGNLSYEIFSQIASFLSIETTPYYPFQKLIDEVLLYHRNKIAHGERLEIDAPRYSSLHDDIVQLLSNFKQDIESAAINRGYRR